MTSDKRSEATPSKPEWFELINGAAPSANVTKVNKLLPAMAVLVSGALLASGAFFATASDTPAPATPVSQATSAATPTAAVTAAPTAAPSSNPNATQISTTTGNPTISPTQPIMLPPTGGRHDDDEREGYEGRGHHEDNEDD